MAHAGYISEKNLMCSRLPASLTSQAALMPFLSCVETNITSHTLGTALHVQKKGVFRLLCHSCQENLFKATLFFRIIIPDWFLHTSLTEKWHAAEFRSQGCCRRTCLYSMNILLLSTVS